VSKIFSLIFLFVLLVTLFGTLSGCSRGILVKVEGKYGHAIYFRLYDPTGSNLLKHNVTEVIVREKKENNQWEIVWALSGTQSIDEIQYGEKLEGFHETTRAKPLSLNKEYHVFVKDLPWFDPPGFGHVVFTINESGEIVTIR